MNHTTTKLLFLAALFFCIFGLAKSSQAATYWISPTGTAANLAACSGSTPLSGTAACSYDKANGSGVVAGDTVYYRAGTYNISSGSVSVINPYNTGTSGSIITFSSYNNEDVQFVFTGSALSWNSYAVNLDSENGTVRSYIKVNDLHFTNFTKHLWIRKGGHNEISYSSFTGLPTGTVVGDWDSYELNASYIQHNSQYNWIHHNTFSKWGWNRTSGYDAGGVFGMGTEQPSSPDATKYNLVENNEMYAGAHHVGYLNGSNNIYRNNYFHNEPWWPFDTPIYATRVLAQEGSNGDGSYNLNEGNRIGYGGPKHKTEIGGNTTQVKGSNNIWRYNVYAQTYLAAMYVVNYGESGLTPTEYNKIYNNTFWKGGYGSYQEWPSGVEPSANWFASYTHAINFDTESANLNHDNAFKNNLFYQYHNHMGAGYDFVKILDSYSAPTLQIISNNWLDNAGDPKFVDISAAPNPAIDPMVQWNFNLQSDSPSLNGGTHLTTATNSGNSSTNLTVATTDASYFFYDVGGMSSVVPFAGQAAISSDWIAIGTVSNVVQISSINYSTGAITLASLMTWSNGASIWLYKKSDGTRVLYGTAPEYGAYEYVGSTPPPPPDTTPPVAPTGVAVQ